MSDHEPTDSTEQTGSVSEEAAKLVSALQDWAKDNGSDYADAAAQAAAGAASSLGSVNEHLATDGEDCRYCPLCQVIGAARGMSPEVKDHLRVAASSLLKAVAGAMATPVPDQPGKQPRGSRVEKIDLGDDGQWEDSQGEEDSWD